MKLFQRLLVAPALLGLIVPVTAKATETNLDSISNYYQENVDLNSDSFSSITENKNLLLSGGEGLVESTSSSDSFSSTTTASFGVNFYVGAVDGGSISVVTPGIQTATSTVNADDTVTTEITTSDATTADVASEAVTFSYDYSMALSTSFTGEDSLDIALIGGNAAGTPVDAFMGGDGTGDALVLDGVSYTFPLGGATVVVGDDVDPSSLNVGACAYSAFTDLLSDCGANNTGGTGDSGFAVAYDFGNGFTMAGGLAGGPGNAGLFTEQDASSLGLEAAYTADTYGVSVAFTDDETVTYWTINAMITPEGFPSISVGYETDDGDADAMFAGLTFDEVGAGSVSVGIASTATDTADNYQYELSYSYPINDGMTITPGVFVAETAGEDDTGFVVKTSFEF
mgnify:CR=1 FL=1